MLAIFWLAAMMVYLLTAYNLSNLIFPIAAEEGQASPRAFRRIRALFGRNRRLSFSVSALLAMMVLAIQLLMANVQQHLPGLAGLALRLPVGALIFLLWVVASCALYRELGGANGR